MRIDNVSQQSFGQIKFSPDCLDFELFQRVHTTKNASKLKNCFDKIADSNLDVSFYQDAHSALKARISTENPYYRSEQVYVKSPLKSVLKFVEKVCKKTIKTDAEREAAKARYDMHMDNINKNKPSFSNMPS